MLINFTNSEGCLQWTALDRVSEKRMIALTRGYDVFQNA